MAVSPVLGAIVGLTKFGTNVYVLQGWSNDRKFGHVYSPPQKFTDHGIPEKVQFPSSLYR